MMLRDEESIDFIWRHWIRDDLTSKHTKVLKELEQQYKTLDREQHDYGSGNAIIGDIDYESPVSVLVSYVTQGEYPPPDDLLAACLFQPVADPIGRPEHLRGLVRVGTDGWDAQ